MESWKMIVVGSIVVLVVCMQATAGEKRPVPDPAKVCVVMEIDKRAPEGLKGRLDDIVNAVGGFQTVPCDDPKNAFREAIQAGAGAILQVELVAGPRQVPDAEYKRPSKPKVKYELQQITSAGPRKIASGTIVAGGEGDKDSEDSGSIRDELAAVLVSKFVPCKIKGVKKGEDPKIVVAVSNRTGTAVNQITLAEGETKLSSENVEIKPRETKEVEISVGGAKFELSKAKFVAVRFARESGDDKGDDGKKEEGKDGEKAEE